MILYNTFYRQLIFRRVGQLGKLHDLSKFTEFPKGSVVHLLDDNFSFNKAITFVPSQDNMALRLKPIYKFIHHVKSPPSPKVIQYPEQFRLPVIGLNMSLNAFRKKNMKTVKPIKDLMDMPTRMGVLNVINYNPLYRARIIGVRRANRRFNYILSSLINMISSLPNTHYQFIPIPVGSKEYKKPEFLPSFKKYTRSTIKFPYDPWYLFMMHLLGFLHKNPTESLLNHIPERMREKVHFILYGKTKMFIFNLKDILDMNAGNDLILNRFIVTLNMLAEDSSEHPTQEVVTQIDQKQFEGGGTDDVEETYEDDDKDFTDIPEQPKKVEQDTQADKELDKELDITKSEVPDIDIPDVIVPDLVPQVKLTNDPTTAITKQPKVIKKVVDKPKEMVTPDLVVDTSQGLVKTKFRTAKPQVKKQAVQQPKVKSPPKQQEDPIVATPLNEIMLPELLDIEEIDPKLLRIENDHLNTHNRVRVVTQKESEKFTQDLMKDIDDRAIKSIEDNKHRLTPAQVKRAEKMSQQYKYIELAGVPIIDLIKETPDDQIGHKKLDFLKDKVPDESMIESTTQSFDKDYLEKFMHKDLVTNLVSFNSQGMFLKDISVTDTSDDLNQMNTYTAKYEDIHHKEHTIRFTLPKVSREGYCLVNGTEKILKKQRVVLPICKISSTRVTLNSDYNKFLVERNTSVAHSFVHYIGRILKAAEPDSYIAIMNSMTFQKELLPYDYTTIASKYIKIITRKNILTTFYFNYPERYEWLKSEMKLTPQHISGIQAIEDEIKGTLIGVSKADTAIFMLLTGEVLIFNYSDGTLVEQDITFIDLLNTLLEVSVSRLTEWVDFKMLNKSVPLVFALCYRFGLNYMLNYTKTKYKILPKNASTPVRNSDIVIIFADAKLVIPRYPLNNSLIFAGLANFTLNKVEIEAMNSKEIYFDLLQSKSISTHNLKGLDDYYELFIDPITKDVLFRMGEPTDPKDLLIRAAQLLSTEDHNDPSSEANYRYRSYERFNSAVYKSIARAYATYKNKSIGATNKMSISDYEVKQLVIEDQLMENADILNPINDIKYKSSFSHSGFGGRQSVDTFVLDDRQYPEDGIGSMSEATVDNMKTGYIASLSVNPALANIRGMPEPVNADDLDPSQMLSITSMLMPGVTNDDGKRANFANIHLSQYMPTKHSEPSRIRTGFEEVIAHRTSPPFAYPAEDDGTVESIDDNTNMAVVFYPKLNKRAAIKFGEEYTNNGGGGFYCTQNITLNNFKVGDKFKRGDILAFNNRYFTPDPLSKQVTWNIGTLANIAIIDSNSTFEDSSIISHRLADALEVNPVFIRDIVLKKNTTVHKFADIGTKISSVESLITFDQSEMADNMFGELDDEAVKMLEKLNLKSARSGHTGVVVKLDMYYKDTIKDVSPSIKSLMSLVDRRKAAIKKSAGTASNSEDFPSSTSIKHSDRIRGISLDDETVIVRFYIQDDSKMGGGDKIEFDSSLKSVCTAVEDAWEVEDGSVLCDGHFSGIGINNRIVLSPIITGIGNRCLEKLEKDVLDIYFKK